MRRVALLPILLFIAACASRDGIIDEQRDCSAGGDLSVDMFLNMPRVMSEGTSDNLMMTVAISNNSTQAVEIKTMRVEPGYTAQKRYALESAFGEFNKVLEPGEDRNFELSVRGTAGQREINPRGGDNTIEVLLKIYLANGVTYQCSYDIQAPQ